MLDFLYYPIAWVMKMWHALFSTFLNPKGGLAWVLSILFLVVTVRILLFPLFVKMIRSQRAMQELQPEIAKLKEEYGKDRQGMSEAMMKLQRERGVNPVAGCLPMLLQAPVFIALLHVLRRLAPGKPGLYSWDDALTDNAARADVFGAPISSYFTMSGQRLEQLIDVTGTTSGQIKVVTGVLIVVMSLTQYITTKQIMKRSPSSAGMNAQMQMVQKLMLYGAPLGLLISGTFFPLGVLLYWFFNNLWTMGQQFWVLKKMPPPGQTKKDEDRPEIDRSKLAPKPGVKPDRRNQRGKATAATQTVTTDSDDVDIDEPDAGEIADVQSTPTSSPSPGQARAKPASKSGAKPRPGSKPGNKPRPGAQPQRRKKR